MCLAIPAKIMSIDPEAETGVVALDGVTKTVSLALIDEPAVDDYVLVHVGYALNKVSVAEAEKTLALMQEAGLLQDGSVS